MTLQKLTPAELSKNLAHRIPFDSWKTIHVYFTSLSEQKLHDLSLKDHNLNSNTQTILFLNDSTMPTKPFDLKYWPRQISCHVYETALQSFQPHSFIISVLQ